MINYRVVIVINIANRQGNGDLQSMIRDIKTKLDNLINQNKTNMTTIYEAHPYWKHRAEDADESKIIRRSIVAQLFSLDETALSSWPNAAEWKSIKARIAVLLGNLEELGCFVLRKGAIESYYKFAPNDTFDAKPSAAALEISNLHEQSDEFINEHYSDLIRALQFAALDKVVDESYAVRKELYSELSLVLGVLNSASTERDLTGAIKQAKGSPESLFIYRIIHDGARIGVEVSLRSEIIDVTGFPFNAFIGDNPNQVIDNHVRPKAI